MHKSLMARWRASFLTSLAVVLPGVITLAVADGLKYIISVGALAIESTPLETK